MDFKPWSIDRIQMRTNFENWTRIQSRSRILKGDGRKSRKFYAVPNKQTKPFWNPAPDPTKTPWSGSATLHFLLVNGTEFFFYLYTVCPRSLEPFHFEGYYIKWGKTSSSYSIFYFLPFCSLVYLSILLYTFAIHASHPVLWCIYLSICLLTANLGQYILASLALRAHCYSLIPREWFPWGGGGGQARPCNAKFC